MPGSRACGTPAWMSRRAVEDAASRAVMAWMAAPSVPAGRRRSPTSTATRPEIVSSNVRHGGATRISSGRRRATKLMRTGSAPQQVEGGDDQEEREHAPERRAAEEL